VLIKAKEFFEKELSIDILAFLESVELLALRRVFQKRHAYIHAAGIIDQRYIEMIPEDSHLLNTKAELTQEELETGAIGMRKALASLVKAMEKPG
jgi:hypothetical protein